MNINYMRQNISVLDISSLKAPLYLYQPDVQPTPEGGIVKEPEPNLRKTKDKFLIVNKDFAKSPDEQSWYLYTSDNRVFKGTPDTFKGAIITRDEQGFHLSFIDNSIKFSPELNLDAKKGLDIDTIQNNQRRDREHRERMMQSEYKFLLDPIKKDQEERERNKKALAKGSDSDADVSDEFDDDDEGLGDLFDDIPEVSDNENLLDSDLSSDNGEEEEKKENKRKAEAEERRRLQAGPQESNEDIVDSIYGPPVIKEDEVVRFIIEIGPVTKDQLLHKFKSKLKTDKQKIAFKEIVTKRLRIIKIHGKTHFNLKKNN
ncbi:hypothetical protein GPJ56_000055 [Histomonas meleagridis]|uniref:uncharacterized protein n=1 Tax=Histomonas meleagridis TaxID=135588 RepID=UPI003559900B|nr:hypothetical protein GPJ56_000055 [Histomonas meleagridis]KAH0805553.1 hypothetical protein GO595_001608 [Histomonas meleagridis]